MAAVRGDQRPVLPGPLTEADRLVAHAATHEAELATVGLSPAPGRRLAVVACMDARLDLFGMLGLRPGDAHLIRNAGGVVTDDVIRSLTISQRKLGTREIVLVHHTDCGLLTFTDDAFRNALEDETGIRPPWSTEAFRDVDGDVRQSMARIATSPFVLHKEAVRGFVFEVETGRLREVDPESPQRRAT
ncbi:MAG TPA: carbonic anhydrase [Solirubrobacteraceae bacterium]|nr:carbonic anhydrase [Solirubrobacteraceae bacterium]